jgi:hypothetical protein
MSTYNYKFDIVETDDPRIARLIRLAAGTLGVDTNEFAKRATISVAMAMLESERDRGTEPTAEETSNGESENSEG